MSTSTEVSPSNLIHRNPSDNKPGVADREIYEQTQQKPPSFAERLSRIERERAALYHEAQYFDNTPSLPSGPSYLARNFGNPTPLAIAAFSTTLTSLSWVSMGFRGVHTANVFIADFFWYAGVCMIVAGQWELVIGNTFPYVVFSSFGAFYAGYGGIITPFYGVNSQYSTKTELNNAYALYVTVWCILVFIFLLASLRTNVVFIGIFLFVEAAFVCIAASYYAAADGLAQASTNVLTAGGAFAFVAGLLGWYLLAIQLLQALEFPFEFPVFPTDHLFLGRTAMERVLSQRRKSSAATRVGESDSDRSDERKV